LFLTVLHSQHLDEINRRKIDGSDDNTLEIINKAVLSNPHIQIIHTQPTRAKGQLLFTGWRATEAECLLFIDADLINLTPAHVQDLIAPVREHQAQMTYGLFRGGHWDTDFSHWIAPVANRTRCLRRRAAGDVPEEAAQGYGSKLLYPGCARNIKWISQGIRMQGVSHPVKKDTGGY